MLKLLYEVEARLPELLQDKSEWQSVYVNYHPPFVERLWRQYGDNRIYLHRIHPCTPEEVLFHPHPWPSAMRVCSGSYEMFIGFGSGTTEPPEESRMSFILKAGSTYNMPHIDTWHSVRPLERPSYSIMVTGKTWVRRSSPKSKNLLSPLNQEQCNGLFSFFNDYSE